MKRRRPIQDPVCGKRINRNKAHIVIQYKGARYFLCCPLCQAEFERDPAKYATHGR
ncbi:MAG: YHS domain-containing protein [Gammaproteobacteria bacterium]|nr:YHS domain-containing protein [Gammaproteobacteria bacterium]NIU06540.1 YHS domain-containing protein [Gammaproteobacteria bacterium]NIV53429.1 YHS domain-containing protein [Gammaproteobacteria bacterium]NIW85407.1 YHS domain-containing protein [Gammaproteobacteria bacterium]NIX87813.1 YHS domain-containing protein [Gammaproteobacteria bacterium]